MSGADLRGIDFFSFYAASKLFLTTGGRHLYDFAAQAGIQSRFGGSATVLPYIHPPHYVLVIGQLGRLTLPTAYFVWSLLNALLATLAVLLLVKGGGLKAGSTILATTLLLAFAPLLLTVVAGQSDVIVLAALCGAYLCWSSGRRGWAGAFTALALVKPHLILLLPLLFLARRSWRALIGFSAVACIASLVSILLVGFNGITSYLQVLFQWAWGVRVAWPITIQSTYSLRQFLEVLPGGRLTALGILAALLIPIAISLSWRPDVQRLDMALAITASLLLSPYTNLEDLAVLIVPGFALVELALRGESRWPNLALPLSFGLYSGVGLSFLINGSLAALLPLILTGYLVAERLSRGREPLRLVRSEFAGPRPRRIIVLPAYNAAATVRQVVAGIPATEVDAVLLVDDASKDSTISVAAQLKLHSVRHPRNLGYGGNQKTCYMQALAMGAEVVVMLHPDGQYDPAVIPRLCTVIEEGQADIVLGSRWLGLDPATAGMPMWKRLGNRFLTSVENRVLGLHLSEYHTGYRAYSRRFLETVPFLENSNDFVFDSQILVQAATFGFRIGEVPAIGRYFKDASSVGLGRSISYGMKTLAVLGRYVLHCAGFGCRWLEPNKIRIAGQTVDDQAPAFVGRRFADANAQMEANAWGNRGVGDGVFQLALHLDGTQSDL